MTDKRKPTIMYDHKMCGLIVTVSEADLTSLAKQECEKHGHTDFLERDISHVMYCPPVDEEKAKRKARRGCGLVTVGMVLWWLLIILGAIKLAELMAEWIT